MNRFNTALMFIICSIPSLYAQELSVPQAVHQRYTHELEQEHTSLINNLLRIFDVSNQEWQEELIQARRDSDQEDEACKARYTRMYDRINPELEARFHALLRAQGINGSDVIMINNGGFPEAGKGFVGCSKHSFDSMKLTVKEQDALLLHEIAHIIHEDVVVWNALYSLLNKTPWYRKAAAFPLMVKWHWFKERRADLTACLAGYSYAQALGEALRKIVPFSSTIQTSHPTFKSRARYIQAFCEHVVSDATTDGAVSVTKS
ncbi:hypothetical protein KJZ61_04175 [Candidatus Dependentiae bacterium]|nr:hypothetical protein [Candidatus Dependentiae bacterium]